MNRREFVRQGALGAAAVRAGALAGVVPGAVPDAPMTAPSLAPPERPQGLTWDAGSGPDRAFWSQKLHLPWVHPGVGDWRDAHQQVQGPLSWASTTVSATGVVECNVTALVQHALRTGTHRGFYLRSTENFAITLAGRIHPNPAARPVLVLETEGAILQLPSLCNANWTPSAFGGMDSRQTFALAAGNQFAALHFDLQGAALPVRRALLRLTCLALTHPATVEVMELDPPPFRVGGGGQPATWGLAREFTMDRDLERHPAVLFAGDFADLSRTRWQTGGLKGASSQIKNPQTGSTALRGQIGAGQLLGCDLEHSLFGAKADGTPERVETELHARYYLLLEDDWGSEVDANKMPGWDARLGWWNPVGYWQNTTGNGGVPTTGLKVRNDKKNRWEYEGASMRGYGGMRSNDGNPYDHLFWLGSYIEHLDQGGIYGEALPWPGVVIDRGRWHCIEQRIRMNSITGPFDALGNGAALRDGQYTVWMDGVLAFHRSNLAWRRHPEMGIQGFWLNWYHGGMRPPTHDMHYRMDAVVIARSYIGPRWEPGAGLGG